MTSEPRTPPILDLAAPETELGESLAAACAEWGFFHITGHGISADLLHAALAVSRTFFEQPAKVKQALSRTEKQPWGYYDRELTKGLRDRKEIFDFGNIGSVPWPDSPPDFEAASRKFSAAMHALSVRISVLLAQSLGLPTEHVQSLAEQHSSFTRLNHYPVEDSLALSTAPPTGPFGISHHTDAGVITLLVQDAVGGLQMQHRGQWIDVEAQPHTLTVNIGDMFQVWTNDRIRAPVHRVLASTARERYSIAYFLNPGAQSVIAPLPQRGSQEQAHYDPIHWSEFRGLRALGDYGDYGEEVQISHYRRQPATQN